MKKGIKLFASIYMLILLFSITVFTDLNIKTVLASNTYTYTDFDTGLTFTVPENWREKPLSKERLYLDVKFVPENEDGNMIIYGSYDMWEEMSDTDKVGYTRADINSSAFTKSDIAEMAGVVGSDISVISYNGIEYFQCEMTASTELDGVDYEATITQLLLINDGWMHIFQCNGTSENEHFIEFEKLLNSVDYPNAKQETSSALNNNSTSATPYLDLFAQGPKTYIPILAISLAITILAYGVFPLIFSNIRKKVISRKKYTTICYCVNLLVNFIFVIINGKSSIPAYLLWTSIFAPIGIKTLISRQVLEGFQPIKSNDIGFDDEDAENSVGKNNRFDEEAIPEIEKIQYCRKCGFKLTDDSEICSNCGANIYK